MKPEEKEVVASDIKDEFKNAKKSFFLKLFPFLEDLIIKIVTKILRRKGLIDCLLIVLLAGGLAACSERANPFKPILNHSEIKDTNLAQEAGSDKIVNPDKAETATEPSLATKRAVVVGLVLIILISIVCIAKKRIDDRQAL